MKGTLHEERYTFLSHLAQFFLEWKMFQAEVVEKLETHILCSVTFFFRKSCRLWDNVEKCGRPGQATDDNMAHAHCMLNRATSTHTGYVILNPFPPQQWLHEFASMLRYIYKYIVCLVSCFNWHICLLYKWQFNYCKKKTDTWLWKMTLLENECPEFCKRLQITLEHNAQIFWAKNITFS
jgi:hypothetical protein